MAARSKRSGYASASEVSLATRHSRTSSSIQFRASHHRDELLEEARALMAAGRVREARALEKRAGQVEQLLGAIESEVPASTRGARGTQH